MIDPKRLWFTSDTHFSHKNIIKYCNRPFSTFEEMDEELIRRWNMVVTPRDVVWHLGDFAFGRDATKERVKGVFERLNGQIHLIRGNHDKPENEYLFSSVRDYHELEVGDKYPIVLFHYPIKSWNRRYKGALHLYGHVHGNETVLEPGSFDVGVDTSSFAPISLNEAVASAKRWR